MEEKYPIRFSLGQFIVLLGVEVLVLALVFLLGARFGGGIFEKYYAASGAADEYQALNPDTKKERKTAKKSDEKLMGPTSFEDEALDENEPAEEDLAAEDSDTTDPSDDTKVLEAQKKAFANTMVDKNTMVRFKSSDNSKFAIEVGNYSEEIQASQEVARLKQKGYEAYIVIENFQENEPSFSVRVGSFGDRKTAEDFSVKMSNAQGLELRVVRVD